MKLINMIFGLIPSKRLSNRNKVGTWVTDVKILF